MSGDGTLPSEPPQSGSPQHLWISSGNNSPVNVNAPQAHVAGGGTANANVTVNLPAETPGDSYPKSRLRDPKLVGIGTLAIVIGTVILVVLAIATLYVTVYPHK
jgi:hypothetical protein